MKRLLYIYLLSLTSALVGQNFESKLHTRPINQRDKSVSNVTKYLNSDKWDYLFPNRYGRAKNSKKKFQNDFYSFKNFVRAASYFPDFLASTDTSTQKRELAAFLANIAQETSGGWDTAPGGYFVWGLVYIEELQPNGPLDYSDYKSALYPPVKGKRYYGRGPKQISWNYNYGQFSEAWYGNKTQLLEHPERLSTDPLLSFASAIWFWMTPQYPKPSCHDVMTGNWTPTENDSKNGRVPGFGCTLNIINGGIECGMGYDLEKTTQRYKYYEWFCNFLKVTPGENVSCRNQKPFGK